MPLNELCLFFCFRTLNSKNRDKVKFSSQRTELAVKRSGFSSWFPNQLAIGTQASILTFWTSLGSKIYKTIGLGEFWETFLVYQDSMILSRRSNIYWQKGNPPPVWSCIPNVPWDCCWSAGPPSPPMQGAVSQGAAEPQREHLPQG